MANYVSKHTGAQIDAAVDAVLAGNGGTGGSVEVDTTLKVSGKAADAKVVGDRLTSLTKEIEELKEGESNEVTMSGAMVTVAPGEGKSLEVVQNFDSPNALDKLYLHQVTSENLFDFVTWFGGAGKVYEKNGLKAVINANSTVTVTGTNTSDSSTNIIDVAAKQPYAYHVFPAGKYNIGYNKIRVAITGVNTGTNYGNKTQTFEIPEPFRIRGVFAGYSAGEGTDVFNTMNMFMVKTDSDATDQAPADCTYVGEVHIAEFTTPHAKGTFNWATGEVKDEDGNLVENIVPVQVAALDGANKIFGAFGDVDVTYEIEDSDGSGSIEVDATLKQEGKAADAKAVGDAVEYLSEDMAKGRASIPDYVKTEALQVAQKVKNVRTDDSIVFIAMSDNHHYGGQGDAVQYPDADGVKNNTCNAHAAMAAKILAYALDVDFIAQLGDFAFGHAVTTSTMLHGQVAELKSYYRDTYVGPPLFHAIGNHDTGYYHHERMIEEGHTGVYTESGKWLYDNFTALSDSENTVFGGQENGGYCYRDFADKKIRVFLLNTCEGMTATQVDSGTSGAQRAWLADALTDLNSKGDASAWGIVILSHYPADYATTMPLSELIKAYVEGGSIAITLEDNSTKEVSFAGKNSAKLIAQFHGHVHNFKVAKLYSYATGQGVQYDAWRISIPNGQYNRENCEPSAGGHADIDYSEPIDYTKTLNTAQETSFVVNVINPTEQKIYSFCYGAGRDRVIGYGDTAYYSVYNIATSVTLSGKVDYIKAGDPISVGVTPADGCKIAAVQVTMGGVDITNSAYAGNTISIASVTGDVVITATATPDLDVVNQIPISTDATGNIYNSIGYKKNTFVNNNGVEATSYGYYTTGYIPCSIGDVIRFLNMSFVKGDNNCRIVFYDANKTFLKYAGANSSYFMDTLFEGVLDGDNYVRFTLKNQSEISATAYIRICCARIAGDSVLTVNEEI